MFNWFSNLPGINRTFLPKDIRDFMQKSFEKPAKRVKIMRQISLVSLPDNDGTYAFSCILPPWKNGITLNNKCTPEEDNSSSRLAHLPKTTARAKACRSHYCKARARHVILGTFKGFLHKLSAEYQAQIFHYLSSLRFRNFDGVTTSN